MSTRILEPVEIADPLTSVPQVTDNQFVPPDVFQMIAGRRPLDELLVSLLAGAVDDAEVRRYAQRQSVEYMRALLYSRRVILNRAAFWNNPVLISAVLGRDCDAVLQLMAETIIVPYLFRESAFEQQPSFRVLPKGRDAVREIARSFGEQPLNCVRLKRDPDENGRLTGAMGSEFRLQLVSPLYAEDADARHTELALALLGHGGRKRISRRNERRAKALARRIEDLNRWVSHHKVTRERVYAEFITVGDPARGYFRTDDFTFELKLWIDLVYNSNLPRFLGARAFVPHDFPTPFDAGLVWALVDRRQLLPVGEPADDALTEIIERAQSDATWAVWNDVQHHADLCIPSPHELTHSDVVEIREWHEWQSMIDGLRTYMERPLDLEDMAEFHASYDEFQRRLSRWWLERGSRRRARWVSGTAKVYRLGAWVIGILRIASSFVPILPPPGVELPPLPDEDRVAVVVETGLYSFEQAKLDWRRTQLVREIRNYQTFTRDQLLRTWRDVQKLAPAVREAHPGVDYNRRFATDEQYA